MARDTTLRNEWRNAMKAERRRVDTILKQLADDLAKVNDKTRRGFGTLNFLALGSQNLDIVWSSPFPDDQYGVWIQTSSASPAQVHAIPLPATKTAAGITVTVVAALAVGDVIVNVLAERSA